MSKFIEGLIGDQTVVPAVGAYTCVALFQRGDLMFAWSIVGGHETCVVTRLIRGVGYHELAVTEGTVPWRAP